MTRPEAVRLAYKMYGTWTAEEIRLHLAEHGVSAGLSTIREWADEDLAQRNRRRRALAKRQRRVMNRMLELQGAGLSHGDIAAVLELDYGLPVTREAVRYSLGQGRVSRNIRKALA